MRLVGRDLGRRGLDEIEDFGLGSPGRITAVEHHRQHQRQEIAALEPQSADDLAIEADLVVEHPQRHEVLVLALELEQQVDVDPEPGAAPAQAPDHVVVADTRAVSGMGLADGLEGLEVEAADPVAGHEAADQAFDQVGVGEESFVTAVVASHGDPRVVVGGLLRSGPPCLILDELARSGGLPVPSRTQRRSILRKSVSSS